MANALSTDHELFDLIGSATQIEISLKTNFCSKIAITAAKIIKLVQKWYKHISVSKPQRN